MELGSFTYMKKEFQLDFLEYFQSESKILTTIVIERDTINDKLLYGVRPAY